MKMRLLIGLICILPLLKRACEEASMRHPCLLCNAKKTEYRGSTLSSSWSINSRVAGSEGHYFFLL